MKSTCYTLVLGSLFLFSACHAGKQSATSMASESVFILVELQPATGPDQLLEDFPDLEVQKRVNRTKNEWLCKQELSAEDGASLINDLNQKKYVIKAEIQKTPDAIQE